MFLREEISSIDDESTFPFSRLVDRLCSGVVGYKGGGSSMDRGDSPSLAS